MNVRANESDVIAGDYSSLGRAQGVLMDGSYLRYLVSSQ